MKERKRGARSKRTGEPLLFREAGDVPYTAPPLLVLTSNFTIGPLLARGCLLSIDETFDERGASAADGRLVSGVAPLSHDVVDALVSSARNVVPIAVELAPDRGVRKIAVNGTSKVIEAVCLSDVHALLFRNEKEVSRFSAIEFNNYSLESLGIALRVDAGAFESAPVASEPATREDIVNAQDPASATTAVALPIEADDTSLVSIIRRVDSAVGLLSYLLTSSPPRGAWMRGVQALVAGKNEWLDKASWPERLAAVILGNAREISDADGAILSAVIEIVLAAPVEDGWAADQVLADIRRLALQRIPDTDGKNAREVTVWADRAAEILSARAEPHSLGDDAHILPRAILLLLLRGDVDAISNGIAAASARQRPGHQVLGIASSLAAYRSGVRALPARFKAGSEAAGSARVTAYLGELFAALLEENANTLFPSALPKPSIVYRRIRTLQGEWVVTVSGKELARLPASFDTGLERLLTMGRDLGFEFDEHGDSGLVTIVKQDDRSRPVYLKVLRGDSAGGGVVRFSSPTLKLVGVNSRSRLPRELLLDLLTRNAGPDMNCRFAIEEDDGVIVVLVDQLLGTLDEDEFRKHVQHVAQVAADFELSRQAGAEVS